MSIINLKRLLTSKTGLDNLLLNNSASLCSESSLPNEGRPEIMCVDYAKFQKVYGSTLRHNIREQIVYATRKLCVS